MLRTSLYTLLTFAILPFLVACEGDNTRGKQNSQHGLVNTPPVAKEANLTLKEDNTVAITLSATDVDKDTLGYRVSQQPTHGTLTGKAPELTYRPDKDYNGADSLIFIANDGLADSNAAVVRLTLTPVNDAPVADADTVTLDEDTHATIKVLENDSDVDKNESLSIQILRVPKNGIATIEDNHISYQPNPDYFGNDTMIYRLTDRAGAVSDAEVTLTITPINDAPIAQKDQATTPVDHPIVIPVVQNDTDADADRLFIKSLSTPQHGTAILKNNQILYTPTQGYIGSDTITYTIKDKESATAQADIAITVRALSDEEKYQQLEESGVIPKLDRSDSLGGTDSDNNGIRDDVDAYIEKHYTNLRELKAARQMARAYQEILLVDKSDMKKVMEVASKTNNAVSCTVRTSPSKPILENIKAVTLNTKLRVREFFAYDDLLDGTVSSSPKGDTCEK